MQRRLKPFPILPFGVYPHRARALSLSPINPRRPDTLMAVFARQDVLHSLWFSSSSSWTEHGSMSLSSTCGRKKETHYCQGWIPQHLNFSTSYPIKPIQPSNLGINRVALQNGSSTVDYASYQEGQSSSSGITDCGGKYDRMNEASSSDGWESASERIGYNGRTDRAQVHTLPARTGHETNFNRNSLSDSRVHSSKIAWAGKADVCRQHNTYALKKALPQYNRNSLSDSRVHSSKIAWAVKADVCRQHNTYALKKALPEATPVEDPISKDPHSSLPNSSSNSSSQQLACKINEEKTEETCITNKDSVSIEELKEKLVKIYDKVLVVDDVTTAKQVVLLLTTKYKDLIHACDTEVSGIDVKQDTPVDHGEIICFSIYSGPQADFGNGKYYIWVDVLDGGQGVLNEFSPFFEDPTIKKVWHNYSFDVHIIENFRIQVSGFHADTMHLARLWDSSRKIDGGYSLEALTGDEIVMSGIGAHSVDEFMGKISMKTIFGKKKLKKDGKAGKSITMAPVELLQREERILWICYSVLDSVSTLRLYESLKAKLKDMDWYFNGKLRGKMYNFYEEYWRPFGLLLTKMETEGLLVDRAYLSDVEKIAIAEQQAAACKFRSWASKYCPDAEYMNVGSDTQIRQLFFGGVSNRKDSEQKLPLSKTFKVPNVENFTEDGKKPSKYRNITLHSFGKEMNAEMYTASGWPSMSGDVLKTIAGKISPDCIYPVHDGLEQETEQSSSLQEPSEVNRVLKDISIYGTAYNTFGEGKEGKEACHAIAALCEVCSIDSLISNFILPLQGAHISGKDGRIHCSLNINTETGRLSARRPNLQNQPALEKDRYKIRQAFIAGPENSLIVADYGQLELRILAHLANCKSMLDAFKAGGDFHSRTAMNMYSHVREAVEKGQVLLEWYPQTAEEKPPAPLLKDAFAAERRKAKSLNFSIAYGKTPQGLSRDWKVPLKEAKKTVELWYNHREEVLKWQEQRKEDVNKYQCVDTLLGRKRRFPSLVNASYGFKSHIERAAINTPVQGSAADVAMCAMLEINRNARLKELGWKLLLQVHDEVILEGPTESSEIAKDIVIECMSKPFKGKNILNVDLAVDAKCAQNWYAAK